MQQRDIYKVKVVLAWEGEAVSTQDAKDKAEVYFANHLDEGNFQIDQREIWVDTEE